MKIEHYLLKYMIWLGLVAAIGATATELYINRTINASLVFNFGSIAALIIAIVLERLKQMDLAGIVVTLSVMLMMILELELSGRPQQGTLAIFLAIAMSNSVIFSAKIRVLMHAITLSILSAGFYYLSQSSFMLPLEDSFLNMYITTLAVYSIIGFSVHTLKSRYDGMIEKINRFNEELEDQVKTRTRQLSDYSVKNSHEVRAPLTRILSLVELSKRNPEALQEEQHLTILEHSAKELDSIIKEVNLILNKEEKE